MTSRTLGLLVAPVALVAACMQNQPPPAATAKTEPEYPPAFKYAVAQSPTKADVAIGVVAPQFSGDGTDWWKARKHDECSKALVRGFRDNFESLFIAKGFTTAGPFESVEDMAYQDKQGSNMVVYPVFDVEIAMTTMGGRAATPQTAPKSQPTIVGLFGGGANNNAAPASTCTAKLSIQGNVKLTVVEPVSGQKLWDKPIDVSEPDKKLEFKDDDCVTDDEGMLRGAKQAWGQAHVDVFQSTMKELDRQVSVEQFQNFKAQAAKIRESVVYQGH